MATPTTAQLLTEINRTLADMNTRSRAAARASRLGAGELIGDAGYRVSQAAGGAIGLIGASSGAAATGTLFANARSLLGEIGTNEAFIRQMVRLSGALTDVKDAWRGLSQQTKEYAINSTISIAAIGGTVAALARLAPLAQGIAGTIGARFPGAAMGMRSLGGALFDTHGGGVATGLGIASAGYGVNQLFGRNIVGDVMQAGGESYAAYQFGGALREGAAAARAKYPTSRLAGGAARAIDALGAVAGPVGTAYAIANLTTPTAGQAVSENSTVRRAEEALSQHEYGFAVFSPEGQRHAALRGLGYSQEQIDAAQQRAGLSYSWWGMDFASVRQGSMGQRNVSNLAQELADPGSTTDPLKKLQNDRSRIIQSLGNFQSRQFGIGDLHDVVQQQAVMDPAQKDDRQRELRSLENVERMIQEEINRRAGASPSSSVSGGGASVVGDLLRMFR